jgi:hypothetical protein
VDRNFFYNSVIELGYDNRENRNLAFKGNYVSGVFRMKWFSESRVIENTFYLGKTRGEAAFALALKPGGSSKDYFIEGNSYYSQPGSGSFYISGPAKTGRGFQFPGWQRYGYDVRGRFIEGKKGVDAFVRRNPYDPNRAHMIVYNWAGADEVEIDERPLGLQAGDQLEVRNAQNYYAESVRLEFQGEPLKIRMTGWTAVEPLSIPEERIERKSTFPEFGVFVLQRIPRLKAPAGGSQQD